jgi:hypothetical protein
MHLYLPDEFHVIVHYDVRGILNRNSSTRTLSQFSKSMAVVYVSQFEQFHKIRYT